MRHPFTVDLDASLIREVLSRAKESRRPLSEFVADVLIDGLRIHRERPNHPAILPPDVVKIGTHVIVEQES